MRLSAVNTEDAYQYNVKQVDAASIRYSDAAAFPQTEKAKNLYLFLYFT